MEKLAFHEVVIGIIVGDIVEGTEFNTSSGSRVVYKEGVLSWVTSGGYIGSNVGVTTETLAETFSKATVSKQITFAEAVDALASKTKVTFVLPHQEYVLDCLDGLDDTIEKHEYLTDLYRAKCYVDAKEKVEEVKPLPFPEGYAEAKAVSEDGYSKKLTKDDAFNILHLFHFSKHPVAKIAENFQVSTRMIYYVIDGTHWNEAFTAFHEEFCVVQEDYIK